MLHTTKSNRSNRTRCPAKRVATTRDKLQMEQLEKRELFVAGATFIPAVDTAFDGVVQIVASDGGRCSGTLLSSGRHVLTAAHCVDLDGDIDGDGRREGNGVLDPVTYRVQFNLPSGNISIGGITTADVAVPAAWTGEWNPGEGGGNDIAILTLPELAPVGSRGADKYDIYRGSAEVGTNFTVVGYGATGRGIRFDPDGIGPAPVQPAGHDNSFGTRRRGNNSYDSTTGGGTILRLDLDNAAGEVITAPGDSGGPSFIGRRIAGVTSYGNYLSRLDNFGNPSYPGNAFGATAGFTRVSQFASWIDSVTDDRYDLVLDMNNQVDGNDGNADLISVRRSGAYLQLLVNGSVYHSDLATNIRSVTIRGSGDNDLISLATPLAASIDGGGGSNTLAGPTAGSLWKITATNAGNVGTQVNFSNVQNLKGGSGADIFSFNDRARVSGFIDGQGGTDVLAYNSYRSAVEVNLQRGTATGAASVRNIENVKGGHGDDFLVGNSGANYLYGNGGNDILDGGGGNDRLYGHSGRDLLIGGTGSDRLEGGGDDDILIGGRMNADARRIRREWTRTDANYYTRRSHLRYGGGLNGSSILSHLSSVEVDDGANDYLYGQGGSDWFWGMPWESLDRGAEYLN